MSERKRSVSSARKARYEEAFLGEEIMAIARHAPRPFRGWYWFAAAAVLLFMLAGVAGYLVTVLTPVEKLGPEQRAVMEAMPSWQTSVYAIAVWSGFAGSIGLLMRRRWSVPLLMVSLIFAIGTFLPFAAVPAVRALATPGDWTAAVIVVSLCALSYALSRHALLRGWLK